MYQGYLDTGVSLTDDEGLPVAYVQVLEVALLNHAVGKDTILAARAVLYLTGHIERDRISLETPSTGLSQDI